jgi:hypothetical protein
VLCGRITLFQLAEVVLESLELRMFVRDGALCIVKGLGKGYLRMLKAFQVVRVLLCGRHTGRTRRGGAGGIEDTCKG